MKEHLAGLAGKAVSQQQAWCLTREYLQARILQSLQELGIFTQWAFLGGTALRFLYDLPRFSEDLDFSIIPETMFEKTSFRSALSGVSKNLAREAYQVEIMTNEREPVFSAFFRFPGLPFELGLTNRKEQKISIKIEVDTNPPSDARIETSLVRRHATLNLCHYDRPSLLSGKLHAVLCRRWTKGRDLYDLAWYLADRRWPPPNLKLLNSALQQTGWRFPPLTEENWRQTVAQRLDRIDWAKARNDVFPFLERESDIALIDQHTIEKLLSR